MAEAKTPTEEEIQALPRWARVAFAARCARRVQPLFAAGWPDAPAEHIGAVDRAITLSEQAAANAAAGGAFAAANAAIDAAAANAAIGAAFVAADAALAAAHADAADDAASAAAAAARAAVAAHAATAAAAAAIRRDYRLLLEAASVLGWTDDTPVPPEFFGPLWPEGIPEGWPRPKSKTGTADRPLCLKLEIAVPAGMSERDSKALDAKIKELLAAMSGFDAAMGGNGLKIIDECSNEPLLVEDEAPDHEDILAGSGGAR